MAKDYNAVCVKIRKHILNGVYPTQAAKLAGISRDTYHDWMNNKPTFSDFIDSVESELEAKWVKETKKVAIDTKNAMANVNLLERRFKDRWASKSTTELTGANGQSVVFKVDASGGYIPPNNVLGVVSTLEVQKKDRESTPS